MCPAYQGGGLVASLGETWRLCRSWKSTFRKGGKVYRSLKFHRPVAYASTHFLVLVFFFSLPCSGFSQIGIIPAILRILL